MIMMYRCVGSQVILELAEIIIVDKAAGSTINITTENKSLTYTDFKIKINNDILQQITTLEQQ